MQRTHLPRRFELVVLTSNQRNDVNPFIRRLHRHLTDHFDGPWLLTIADLASTDDTLAVTDRVASGFENVGVVSLPAGLDRKALRARWSSSPADVVAFVQLARDRDLDTLLAPLTTVATLPANQRLLNRRSALLVVGGAGLTALLAACGSKSASPSATTQPPAATTAAATPTSVVLAPEMTEGPYYLELDLVRSDVTEDREGATLALNLTVADASTGAAISGAAVDIWHCDATGLYSGFVSASASANGGAQGADDGTFLRGTQLTDASGRAAFTTIYPGWYRGRTVHIHVKVHVSGKVIHVGQLFFDDDYTDTVYASAAPYSSRSTRDTRNTNDGIYSGGGAQSTLVVAKSGNGYAATMTMGVESA